MNQTYIYFSIILTIALAACVANDDTSSNTVPDFDFQIDPVDKRTIHFTNKSTGANVYSWEFGDLDKSKSTSKDVTFKYTKGGTYDVIVNLYAGDGVCDKSKSISKTVSLKNVPFPPPTIVIDGDFTDWKDVPFVVAVTGNGNLQRIKVGGIGDKINIYLDGNSQLRLTSPQPVFDLDMNGNTGGAFGWFSNPLGANMFGDGDVYRYGVFAGTNGTNSWTWSWAPTKTPWIVISAVSAINASTNAVEFSFSKKTPNEISGNILTANGIYFTLNDKKRGKIPVCDSG